MDERLGSRKLLFIVYGVIMLSWLWVCFCFVLFCFAQPLSFGDEIFMKKMYDT